MNNTELTAEYCLIRDRILEKQYSHLNDMQRQAVLTTQRSRWYWQVLVLARQPY